MPQPELLFPPHQIEPVSLAALPRSTSGYILKGEGSLPSYSGKSADIRSGVLAHLNAKHEVGMFGQLRRVELV
jgi:hypothetical protein